MFCCFKGSSRTASSSKFEHYKAPQFGIEDILLPRSHLAEVNKEGHLAGRTINPLGRFQIRLLFNAKHVEKEYERVHLLLPTEALHQRLQIDFRLPKEDYRTCSNVLLNFNDSDPGKSAKATHLVVLKSPYGHGLRVEYTFPYNEVDEMKEVITTMITSIKWVDRNTFCKNVSSRLHGSWVNISKGTSEAADDGKPGVRIVSKKTMNFDEERSFTLVHVDIRRSAENSKPDEDDDENDEHEVVDSRAGIFDVYENPDGQSTLVLLDDELTMEGASVKPLDFDEGKFTMGGETWSHQMN
ncbi:hypothetical protein QQS21_011864 [Conoideocrella luteorostrata]|uniref:Uncharacterized protein n=1 Tax=Conoideocrella luteorostrata TaxID=1105319 RepID=A0AAJ0CDB8_9HYPO|nr:hypothetical protein QQS21_011864 [Conoideocrella luteorostrata]